MPMTIGGQTYSDNEIRQFYANGGNDNQFLQQAGMTDLGQIHDLAVQARGIAGAANPTGDAATQNFFKQYQQTTPNGAYANNYQGWLQDQQIGNVSAMRAGTFTGPSSTQVDYQPGGIFGPGSASYGKSGYASGLGALGNGDGWGANGAASGGGSGGSSPGGGYGGGSNMGFGPSGGGYGGSSYGASSSSSGGGQNPYLPAMADDITRRSNLALGGALQGIQGNSIGVGGLGGSRQGVAQGVAIGNSQDTLQGNLANLYGTDWNNGQNRNVQMYGINTNAALTNQGQQQNFYTSQRGQDLASLQLGAQLYGQGNTGYTQQGQNVYNIGNTQQQAPWQVQNNASQAYSPYTGYGGTNTNSSGGGVNGMVGGALSGAQIGQNLGLGNSSSNGSGWGTGNAWGNQDYGSYL